MAADSLLDSLCVLLIPLFILLHLYYSPFTKVEESFNIQAAHDILTYGIPTEQISANLQAEYDHASFPGQVPRTFVGALVLAGLSRPWISIFNVDRQFLVRAVLASLNAIALVYFWHRVRKAFGRGAGRWYLLFQASQFHIMYYASRTLPNMFAFGLSTLALGNLLPPTLPTSPKDASARHRLSIYLLTIAGVIFRGEIAILLATETAYLLLQRKASLRKEIIPAGLCGFLIGLLMTVSIDSFFWTNFPLWPELAGFYYNAIEGKSSNWGTSPWNYYIVNSLPRLLMNPISWQVCIPLAAGIQATRKRCLDILIPLGFFVLIYSFQPHKEWRFIVYAIPGFTAVAATGASWIWTRRAKSWTYRFLSLALIASTIACFLASAGMLAISRLNYPGAEALIRLHDLAHGSKGIIAVHLDDLSCTTGITRFLEMPAPTSFMAEGQTSWIYDKTEEPQKLLSPEFWAHFDFALMERPEKAIGAWEIVEVIDGFAGIGLTKLGDRDLGDVENARSRPSSAETESSEDIVMSRGSWLKEVEKIIRDKITSGWWIEVKMKPMINIMKRLR